MTQLEKLNEIKTSLDKLAKLGNGEHWGNSDGNVIAQKALPLIDELIQAQTPVEDEIKSMAKLLASNFYDDGSTVGWANFKKAAKAVIAAMSPKPNNNGWLPTHDLIVDRGRRFAEEYKNAALGDAFSDLVELVEYYQPQPPKQES